MTTLPVPPGIDDVLRQLGARRKLSKSVESRVASIIRNTLGAFVEAQPDREGIVGVLERIERCLEKIPQAAGEGDAAVQGDLFTLRALLEPYLAAPGAAVAAAPAPIGPPAFVAPAPVAAPPAPFVPRPARAVPAPVPARPAAAVAPSPHPPPVVRVAPASLAADAAQDWYWFVLDELNGLGTLMAFQRTHGEHDAAVRTERRLKVAIDTLSWDAPAACRDAWRFVEKRLRDADDVWGPHLVLQTLDPDRARVRDWVGRLQSEMRAVIEAVPTTIAGRVS